MIPKVIFKHPEEAELPFVAETYLNMPREWERTPVVDLAGRRAVLLDLKRAGLANSGDWLLGGYFRSVGIMGFVWLWSSGLQGRGSECRLRALWVDPRYRGRGIGSALLRKGVEYAQSRFDYVSARVFYSNTCMLEVVRKEGFRLGYVDAGLELNAGVRT